MRGILWRVLALALAAFAGLLISSWPEEQVPAPVVMSLEPSCYAVVIEKEDGTLECWRDGKKVTVPAPNKH